MPFTFSHPAIVFPIKKLFGKYLSLSALIIGCISPDFEYFLRMRINSHYSHHLINGLLFNLFIGLILLFIFHELVKKSLIDNLPNYFQIRLQKVRNFDWLVYFKQNITATLLALIIGAYTHIIWDMFTHKGGYFVELLQLESNFFHFSYPWYKVLQHGSSIIGGLIIIYLFHYQKKTEITKQNNYPKYWLYFLILFSIFMTFRFLAGLSIKGIGDIIVSAISCIILSLIFLSLYYSKFLKQNHRP
jgi:hypothetical protein